MELRLHSLKLYLGKVLSSGDLLQFEAVPQDAEDNPYKCPWFASLIWRGKRPPIEELQGESSANAGWVVGLGGNNGNKQGNTWIPSIHHIVAGSSDTYSSSESLPITNQTLPQQITPNLLPLANSITSPPPLSPEEKVSRQCRGI